MANMPHLSKQCLLQTLSRLSVNPVAEMTWCDSGHRLLQNTSSNTGTSQTAKKVALDVSRPLSFSLMVSLEYTAINFRMLAVLFRFVCLFSTARDKVLYFIVSFLFWSDSALFSCSLVFDKLPVAAVGPIGQQLGCGQGQGSLPVSCCCHSCRDILSRFLLCIGRCQSGGHQQSLQLYDLTSRGGTGIAWLHGLHRQG
jgi:hypothetical protein